MMKTAKADVIPLRQRTQYTCMTASMTMCLQANGLDCTEDEVNKVMGARPMRGARWEEALACAQHYGMRSILTTPCTVNQLKDWTDKGIPVMIAWNPEGRDWSHASVVFDVTEDNGDMLVHVADPNIPNPNKTVRLVSEDEFYGKWFEKWPDYLVRRPAMAIMREITGDGRQVLARHKTAEEYDCWKDYQLGSLTEEEYLECLERFQNKGDKERARWYILWSEVARMLGKDKDADFIFSVANYVSRKGFPTPKQNQVLQRIGRRYKKELADIVGAHRRLETEIQNQRRLEVEEAEHLSESLPPGVRDEWEYRSGYSAELPYDTWFLKRDGLRVDVNRDRNTEKADANVRVFDPARNKWVWDKKVSLGKVPDSAIGKMLSRATALGIKAIERHQVKSRKDHVPGTYTSEHIKALEALLSRDPNSRFLKSILGQVKAGKPMSERQLAAIRRNFYQAGMKNEAKIFGSPKRSSLADYGLTEPYRRTDAVDPDAPDAFWFTEQDKAIAWRDHHHPYRSVMAQKHFFVLVPSDKIGEWGRHGWLLVSSPQVPHISSTLNTRRSGMNALDALSALSTYSALPGDDSKMARFEEGVPADPCVNMTEEECAEWEKYNEKYEDKFKKKRMARFEEGVPADPCVNMTEEECAEWEKYNEKYEDKFKKNKGASRRQRSTWKRAGGITLWAALRDGVFVGATDNPLGHKPSFWRISGVDTYQLNGVPLPVAEKLVDFGTPAQDISAKKARVFVEKYSLDPIMRTAARPPAGLYGYTKGVQRDVEASIRKLRREARKIARNAYTKDSQIVPFLALHAKRARSIPAKILVAALKDELGGKVASSIRTADDIADVLYIHEDICLDDDRDRAELVRDLSEVTGIPARKIEKKLEGRDECLDDPRVRRTIRQWMSRIGSEADKVATYGVYGFEEKTAVLGLDSCAHLRSAAGSIASSLHQRRPDKHDRISGFLKDHWKQSKCHYSRILNSCYPDSDMRLAKKSAPRTVDDWLAWDE